MTVGDRIWAGILLFMAAHFGIIAVCAVISKTFGVRRFRIGGWWCLAPFALGRRHWR